MRAQYMDEPEGLPKFVKGLGFKFIPSSPSLLSALALKLCNGRYSLSNGERGDLGYDESHEGVFTMARGRREALFRFGGSPVGSDCRVRTGVLTISKSFLSLL